MARLNNGASSVNESPMEFSWDDGCGPVSPDSPFLQRQSNTRASKNSSQAYSKAGFAGQKRTSSELDSPTKNTLPGLRKPEGQTYLFSSQATPSANKFRTPSFTTPQHPIETDFSSGGEVSSPANAADSEGTPDYLPPISRMGGKGNKDLVKFENGKSSKKPQPSSPLGRLRRQYTDVMARRVAKRRKRDADTDVGSRRSSEDSSDGQVRSGQGKRMGIIPSILTFIDAHPGLPNTLSIYVQFFLNVIFAFCLLYVGYGIYSTIRHDIDEKALIESSEIMAEMASCMHNYHANKCERASRVPAMEADCNAWAKCMERDPLKVGRSRLSAGMFAEIFNSFIEPISLKAIIVSVTVIFGCFAINNLSFGAWRARHPSPTASHQAAASGPPMYAYPQHMGFTDGHFTPYQHPQSLGLQSPEREGRGYAIEGGGSPTKKSGYRTNT